MRGSILSSLLLTTLTTLIVLPACGPETSRRGTGNNSSGNSKKDLLAPDDSNPDDDVNEDDADMAVAGGGLATDLAPIVTGDAGLCGPGQSPTTCSSTIAPSAGCVAAEVCGNGADDDCNGLADDGCACIPGEVQKCFVGPPGKRNQGACTDGTQTCGGSAEFASWGDCVGGIAPSSETCDALDNDCDGCADNGLCCGGALSCPGPGDPRIAPILPYSDKALTGGDFYTGAATKWTWTVEGGPCDKLFASPDFTPKTTPAPQSFTLTNGNKKDAKVHFTLSGDYTVTLTIIDADGMTRTCKWIQHVEGPGVRVELCWDHQGGESDGGADLDLHVHKFDGAQGTDATSWFQTEGANNKQDCYFNNCTAFDYWLGEPADFGYSASPLANCEGAKDGSTWAFVGDCGNPRLDLDNVSEVGVPENTNIDAPATGDTFRAAVHYFGQDAVESTKAVNQHPIVNIYCGGTLKATYGQAPNQIPDGFNWGSGLDDDGNGKGMMWRVADVVVTGKDADGNTTCDVAGLHAPAMSDGYWIVTDKNNTDFSY